MDLLYTAYRSPDYELEKWLEKFENLLTSAYVEGYQPTIMGDFNIDLATKKQSNNEWLSLTMNYQLTQIIKEPTRVASKSCTQIDHIFTTHPDKVRATKVSKIALSDH